MAKTEKVTAKAGKDGKPETIEYDFPETLKEAAQLWGEAICLAHLNASATVALQGTMRSKMGAKEPVTGKKLVEALKDWKPSTRTPGKPAAEKVKETFAKLSPEEKAALLKELSGRGSKAA